MSREPLALLSGTFWQRNGALLCVEELDCRAHQVGKVLRLKLLPKLPARVDDGLVAYVEVLGDGTVGFSLGQKTESLQLARGEIREASTRDTNSCKCHFSGELIAEVFFAAENRLDCCYKIVGRCVFDDVICSSGLVVSRINARVGIDI